MTFLDLCSGVGTASLAFAPLGWRCLGHAEIDPFAKALLAYRFPAIRNFGDILQFEEWPDVEPVDLVCAGTPCQSFSLAKRGRAGILDPRGNLMLAFLAVALRYRPRWLVWENVPAVLSANKGRDFAALLGALDECGYSCAWRVLDAQYVRTPAFPFALPQQRKRLFLVGYSGGWADPASVFFEPESMRGDTPPHRGKGQEFAAILGNRAAQNHGPAREIRACAEVSGAVTSKWAKHSAGPSGDEKYNLVAVFAGASPQEGVRRLTPRESERLQGLPDDWTLIPRFSRRTPKSWRAAELDYILRAHPDMESGEALRLSSHPDAPRYRAIGNAWALNCADWVARRITAHEQARAAA